MGKLPIVLFASSFALSSFADDTIYRNDFSTRVSEKPIPELGVWHEAQPYLQNGAVAQRQIISYNAPDAAVTKICHGWGFDLDGYHHYVYFHDFFNQDLEGGHATLDGWFHPNWRTGTASSDSTGYSALWMHRAGINTSDPENPCFWFYYDTATARQGYVLQSLHNTFTNGQLKIQVDMRAPWSWLLDNDKRRVRHCMVFPVYEKYMHNEVWNGESCTGLVSPGKFGLRRGATAGYDHRTYPLYYDARLAHESGTTQLGNNYYLKSGDPADKEKNCYWFRFEVTYDLDTAHFSGSVKSLDAEYLQGLPSDAGKLEKFLNLPHPTFDTQVSSLNSKTFSNALWIGCTTNAIGELTTDMSELWREKGGISGLGLFIGQLKGTGGLSLKGGGGNNHTNQVFVDNIRVSWKAPSAADFDVCYENDFLNRRYRTLCAPAATGSYAVKTAANEERDTFTGYTAVKNIGNNNMLPTLGDDTSVAGEPGTDGWRRHYFNDGNSKAGPVGIVNNTTEAPGDGANMMAFGWNGAHTFLSQEIGTTITSGTVTLQADVFLQGEWDGYTYIEDANRAMLVLGSKAMHTAPTDSYESMFGASFGYRKVRSGSEDAYTYAYQPIKGEYGNATVLSGETAPVKNRWYRYSITADLDNKTYDVKVNALGTDSVAFGSETPADSEIFSAEGLAFDNAVTDIGSFAIYGYGYANATGTASQKNRRVRIDNIVITQGDKTIYSNDFTTRVKNRGTVTRAAGYLAYEYNNDDGPDGWIRQDGIYAASAYAVATVRDDNGNQFVSLGQERESGEATRYGHVLGQCRTKGFRYSVDIRPPLHFVAQGGEASVTIGGRSLEQLQTLGFDTDKMLSFGFMHTATNVPSGFVDKGALFVGDTTIEEPLAAIDNTHWYRFEVTRSPNAATCRVRVYDMGAAHPEVDTAKGTMVAEVDDVTPDTSFDTGLSAFYLTAKQVGHTPDETGVDPMQMLVDNIRVDKINSGFLVIVR